MDGGTFAAINTCWKLVDFCVQLRDVPLENQVFLRLISRVRSDLDEAFRLMRNDGVKAHFAADEGKEKYVEKCLLDVRKALASIGRFVESVRVEEDRNGRIGMVSRFEWVMRHQSKLQTRQLELATCHNSLLQALGAMQRWELSPALPTYSAAIGQSADAEQSDGSDDAMLGPHARRQRRLLQRDDDLIDMGGSHLDDMRTILQPTTLGHNAVADGFAPGISMGGLARPARADTKVFRAEVAVSPPDVLLAPSAGLADEKSKLPTPFPFNLATDEKSLGGAKWPSNEAKLKTADGWPLDISVERKPLPRVGGEARPQGAGLSNLRHVSEAASVAPTAVKKKPLPHVPMGADSAVSSAGTQTASLPSIEQPEPGGRHAWTSTWSQENAARPGWETFVPELDGKPSRKVEERETFDPPSELDSTHPENTAGLRRLATEPVTELPANPYHRPASDAKAWPASSSTLSTLTTTHVLPEPLYQQSSVRPLPFHTISDPGPAPYVFHGSLHPPSQSPAKSISPLDVTPALDSKVNAASTPRSVPELTTHNSTGPYITRDGPVPDHLYNVAFDPVAELDASPPRRQAPTVSSPAVSLRPASLAPPAVSPPSPLGSVRPDSTSSIRQPALAQDSFKEVHVRDLHTGLESGDSVKRVVGGYMLPASPGEDTMKEMRVICKPPVPPKLPPRYSLDGMKEVATPGITGSHPAIWGRTSAERFDSAIGGAEPPSEQTALTNHAIPGAYPPDSSRSHAAKVGDQGKEACTKPLPRVQEGDPQRNATIQRRRAARDLFLEDDG